MTPQPVVADVLGALTDADAAWWRSVLDSPYLRGGVHIGHYGASACLRADWRGPGTTHERPWATASPAEALETLHTRGLWPWSPGDAEAPRWWCEACDGRGLVRLALAGSRTCHNCFSHAFTPSPPSLPALFAVAALGVDHLVRAAAVVAEAWPGQRLVWRVMSDRGLQDHCINSGARHGGADTCVEAFAREHLALVVWRADNAFAREHLALVVWRADNAFAKPMSIDGPDVVVGWHALRALAVRDTDGGPQPTGLHLLTCGEGRVTLGVEGTL